MRTKENSFLKSAKMANFQQGQLSDFFNILDVWTNYQLSTRFILRSDLTKCDKIQVYFTFLFLVFHWNSTDLMFCCIFCSILIIILGNLLGLQRHLARRCLTKTLGMFKCLLSSTIFISLWVLANFWPSWFKLSEGDIWLREEKCC